METNYATDREIRKSDTFLNELLNETTGIRQRLSTFSDKLYSAGFYGPPQDVSTSKAESPQPDNPRTSITDEIIRTNHLLGVIEHQLSQLV